MHHIVFTSEFNGNHEDHLKWYKYTRSCRPKLCAITQDHFDPHSNLKNDSPYQFFSLNLVHDFNIFISKSLIEKASLKLMRKRKNNKNSLVICYKIIKQVNPCSLKKRTNTSTLYAATIPLIKPVGLFFILCSYSVTEGSSP